jgi:hypothetical protein
VNTDLTAQPTLLKVPSTRGSRQGLHAAFDAAMPDMFERRCPVSSELAYWQPLHNLAEPMRPGPLPPLVRVLEVQAEMVGVHPHAVEPGGLDHLAQGFGSLQARWHLADAGPEGSEQIAVPVPSWVTLPPPGRRHPQAEHPARAENPARFGQRPGRVGEAVQRGPAQDRAEGPVGECQGLSVHRGQGAAYAMPRDFHCGAAKHVNRKIGPDEPCRRGHVCYRGCQGTSAARKVEDGGGWVERNKVDQAAGEREK